MVREREMHNRLSDLEIGGGVTDIEAVLQLYQG